MSVCAQCGQDLAWGITDTGRRMPIDLLAADDGNVYFDDDGKHVHVLKRGESTDKPKFHSHFQTCPQGEYQQKQRAKAKPPREALAQAMLGVPGKLL